MDHLVRVHVQLVARWTLVVLGRMKQFIEGKSCQCTCTFCSVLHSHPSCKYGMCQFSPDNADLVEERVMHD